VCQKKGEEGRWQLDTVEKAMINKKKYNYYNKIANFLVHGQVV